MSVPHNAHTDEFAGELEPVAAMLRDHYLVAPSAELTETHLDLMMAAVTSNGVIDLDTIDLRSHRRRRVAVVASLAGALLLGSAGLAAAGVLPAPVQRRVAALVQPLGIQVPAGPEVQTPVNLDPGPPQGGAGSGSSEPAPGQVGVHPTTSDKASGQGGTGSDPAQRGPAGDRGNPTPIGPGGKGVPTTPQGNTQTTDPGGAQSGPSVPTTPAVPTTQGNTQTTDQGGGQAESTTVPTTTPDAERAPDTTIAPPNDTTSEAPTVTTTTTAPSSD